MIIAWWHWLVLGLILVALEMAASGGFYIIFFGVAALVVGVAARWSASAGPRWMQLAAVLGAVGRLAAAVPQPAAAVAEARYAGRATSTRWSANRACRSKTSRAGAVGRAELRGTVWSARNTRPRDRSRAAQRCRVVRVDRLMISHRARRSALMDRWLLIVCVDPRDAGRSSSSRRRRSSCRSRAPTSSSGSAAISGTLERRLPHPGAVRRRRSATATR